MLEKNVEKKCKNIAVQHDGDLYKWVCPGTVGVPDRMLALPFCPVVLIEFKKLGEKPTKIQQYYLDWFNERGFDAYACDSVEKFKEIVNTTLSKRRD